MTQMVILLSETDSFNDENMLEIPWLEIFMLCLHPRWHSGNVPLLVTLLVMPLAITALTTYTPTLTIRPLLEKPGRGKHIGGYFVFLRETIKEYIREICHLRGKSYPDCWEIKSIFFPGLNQTLQH